MGEWNRLTQGPLSIAIQSSDKKPQMTVSSPEQPLPREPDAARAFDSSETNALTNVSLRLLSNRF